MNHKDIAFVDINWMERWGNEPTITIVLKRDIVHKTDYTFINKGDDFLGDCDGIYRFYHHARNNHRGFGGSYYPLKMKPGHDPIAHGWKTCASTERDYTNHDYKEHCCYYSEDSHIVHLFGPWSSNAMHMSEVFGIELVELAIVDGPSRPTLYPHYHKWKRQGKMFSRTGGGTHISMLLEDARSIIDTFVPHVELWRGDYSWTVKRRGMAPKNPRRRPDNFQVYSDTSAEQNMVIYH